MSESDGVQIDAKTRFYLERRQQIEEWAALGPAAEEVRDMVYDRLVEELQFTGEQKGLRLNDCRTGRSGQYRTLSFIRPERMGELERDGTPAASVTVAWTKWSFPENGDAVSVGLRVARVADDWKATHARILELTQDLPGDRRYQTSEWWPLWEDVSVPDTTAWWDDPQLFIGPVRETVERHLDTFMEIVDEVLAARGTQQ